MNRADVIHIAGVIAGEAPNERECDETELLGRRLTLWNVANGIADVLEIEWADFTRGPFLEACAVTPPDDE